MEIPSEVRHLFAAAGWRPARRVSIDDRVPEHHPAHDVLQEMGGLHVGQAGYGIECASSDLFFQFCDEAPEILSTWSELLGCKLIGVAEVHRSHGLLLMDEAERRFGASLIHDAFYFEGHNFGEALTRLLLGRKSRPMLRPDQHQVDLHGETFVRGHPAIFDYAH
jgi:hypothetical protein